MALLFSAVRVAADDYDVEFLVGGIPREFGDFEGWTAFENFIEGINEETEIRVHAEAYLYGEGETVIATPEEVAYIMKRIETSPDFLSSRCDNIEDTDFSFPWTPSEECDLTMD